MKNAFNEQELKTQKTEQQLKNVFLISKKKKTENAGLSFEKHPTTTSSHTGPGCRLFVKIL